MASPILGGKGSGAIAAQPRPKFETLAREGTGPGERSVHSPAIAYLLPPSPALVGMIGSAAVPAASDPGPCYPPYPSTSSSDAAIADTISSHCAWVMISGGAIAIPSLDARTMRP